MSLPRFLLAGVPALALAASGAAAGETAGLPGGAACLLTGCTMSGALSTTGLTTPSLPGLTTDARPPAVFPLPANTPGMVSPDTSRPFSFVGDVTSLAGESPGGLLYVSKNVGGWQGYVTTTASAASSGRIVSLASTADLYAGMTLNGVPVTAIGSGTVTLASALAIAKGATLNFIGAGNGAAIDALVTYRDGPNSNEVAVNGAINIVATRNSQGDAIHGASAIGVSGVANCYAVGCIDGWAGLFAYYDLTGQSNPPHAQYDLELDMYVNGDDQHQQRIDVAFGVNNAAFDPYAMATVTYGLLPTTGPNVQATRSVASPVNAGMRVTLGSPIDPRMVGAYVYYGSAASVAPQPPGTSLPAGTIVSAITGTRVTLSRAVTLPADAKLTFFSSAGRLSNVLGSGTPTLVSNGINFSNYASDGTGVAWASPGARIDWAGNAILQTIRAADVQLTGSASIGFASGQQIAAAGGSTYADTATGAFYHRGGSVHFQPTVGTTAATVDGLGFEGPIGQGAPRAGRFDAITEESASPRFFLVDRADDGLRSFTGASFTAGWGGFVNDGASASSTGFGSRAVAAGATSLSYAFMPGGRFGTVTNTAWASAQPAFRNLLDDGWGNASFVGRLILSGLPNTAPSGRKGGNVCYDSNKVLYAC